MPTKPPVHDPFPHLKRSRAASDRAYEAKRQSSPALKWAKSIRSSQRWNDVRDIKIGQDPICERCEKEFGRTNHRKLSVHHITSLVDIFHMGAEHRELAFTLSNLMTVCPPCHRFVERNGC